MLGFDACLEGLRLSLGASLCRDLPQHSKILCNSNEIFEQLSSIIKKAPKLCRSHVDQANALLVFFLFEHASLDAKVACFGVLFTFRLRPDTSIRSFKLQKPLNAHRSGEYIQTCFWARSSIP